MIIETYEQNNTDHSFKIDRFTNELLAEGWIPPALLTNLLLKVAISIDHLCVPKATLFCCLLDFYTITINHPFALAWVESLRLNFIFKITFFLAPC